MIACRSPSITPNPSVMGSRNLSASALLSLSLSRAYIQVWHTRLLQRILKLSVSHALFSGQCPHQLDNWSQLHHKTGPPSGISPLYAALYGHHRQSSPAFLWLCLFRPPHASDPNGSCLFAAGSPTDTIGSQCFQTLSTRQIAFLVAE